MFLHSTCSWRYTSKLHILVWGFVLLCLPAAAAEPQYPFTARVKADNVNVRAGGNNNFESLAEVNVGDELVVTGKEYSWYKVQVPDGAKMFIKMSYTKLVTTQTAEVTGDRVNVRARANTNAAIIGQLVRGDRFVIKENQGDWLWIRPLAKVRGWVREDLLEFKSAKVASKFLDPADVALKAKVEKDALDRQRATRFSGLKPLADGQYTAEGFIVGDKLMTGPNNARVAAHLESSPSLLKGFTGVKVIVRGAVKEDLARDAVIMTVREVHLSL